jgi:hypothetical protein
VSCAECLVSVYGLRGAYLHVHACVHAYMHAVSVLGDGIVNELARGG